MSEENRILMPSGDDINRYATMSMGETQITSEHDPAPELKNFGNRVIQIYAMNEFVVYVWAKPRQHKEGRTRDPVHHEEAFKRVQQLHKGMKHEDGSKPKDEATYEQWLLEYTLKAIAKCREYVGRPIRSKSLDGLLQTLDRTSRRIYR